MWRERGRGSTESENHGVSDYNAREAGRRAEGCVRLMGAHFLHVQHQAAEILALSSHSLCVWVFPWWCVGSHACLS